MGVYVGAGQSWGIVTIAEAVYRLGHHTKITIDKAAGVIVVDTFEPAERVPHIICGLVLLADPQDRWEESFS